MTAALFMVGVVLPTCSLNLDKVEVVTEASVQQATVCNFENGVRVKIEGNFVVIEAH
jgi:hypothetical protein